MHKIKVAIVGTGNMGQEHIRAFSSLENVEIVGLYNRTKSKAEKVAETFNVAIVADSISELYESSKADLVIIAVPELEANRMAKLAFEHKWTVLMEKPAGFDFEDAKNIEKAAMLKNSSVLVALNRRFYSSTLNILNDLNLRDEKRYIRIQDQQNYQEARRYNHPEFVVERFMYANSIHTIDLLLTFGRGNIIKVDPIKPWQGEKTEVVLVYVEFDSGDVGLYEGIWKGPGPWACSISTPSIRWQMQPLEVASYQNLGERQQKCLEIGQKDKEFKAGLWQQAREVIKYIKGEPNTAVTLKESLKTMSLIYQMFGI